jgi:hypothetical protein
MFFSTCLSFGQNDLANYLKFAEEQYQKGDYIYALEYYQKAMNIDSNTIHILWNYAETLRAYKDYRKAETYYAKVYSREEAMLFPSSLLYLGLMQKQNGKYDEAIETFKLAKKKYVKDKKGYLYLKAKQELESTVWAKSAARDSTGHFILRLPETVNTPNAEFGHAIYNGKLIFSSLRGDSIHPNEEVYSVDYKTKLYQAPYKNASFEKGELIKSLNLGSKNAGNGSFSMDGNRFYFSACTEKGYNYTCKICVATYVNGKWSNIDTLGEVINQDGANTTMPSIGFIDGQEVLFFASDRDGTKGGLDIFYSFIRNGNQFGKVQNLKSANSIDNEIAPFWEEKTKRLYFSSTWHEGFGGFDVFYVPFDGKNFGKPINLGLPTNSPANDTYFFSHNDTNFVSSNRLGVLYAKNPTCCSDIFALHKPIRIEPPTPKETLEELNKRLPVTLYFHNDVPNPRSTLPTTQVNYIDSYTDYIAMIETYKKEYAKGLVGDKILDAHEDIESFFLEYVEQGVKDLELFRDLMLEELEKGISLELTVKGFASPLAKSDYNVNLTKRRIASLVNYLNAYSNGVFKPYLNGTAKNGAKITIKEVPFGEYTANKLISDNPNDTKNSVFSRAASLERKIEIQSISIVQKDSINPLSTDLQLQDFGKIKSDKVVSKQFVVKNSSNEKIEFDSPEIPCECNTATIQKTSLEPGESTTVTITLDPKGYAGNTVKSVYLKAKNSDLKLRLVVTAEIVD